jgi:hypothetical protein
VAPCNKSYSEKAVYHTVKRCFIKFFLMHATLTRERKPAYDNILAFRPPRGWFFCVQVRESTYVCVCMCVRVCEYVCLRVRLCLPVCICVFACVYMCVYLFVVCLCVCVYLRACVYTQQLCVHEIYTSKCKHARTHLPS